MKLTKYGHACVFLDNNGSKVVIDPGEYTDLPPDLENINAVVCTHVHADHTYSPNLRKIVDVNPNVKIYANSETLSEIHDVDCEKVSVDVSKEVEVGGFRLAFYVVDHAVIWKTAPCGNIAVKVDDFYYYPGDSFYTISEAVLITGVPVSAPWLKISEAMEFTLAMDSKAFLPTHNGLLNDRGHNSSNAWLKKGLEGDEDKLYILDVGESYET